MINYILLPVFAILYFGYKFWFKTKIIQLQDIDLFSGRRKYAEEDDKPHATGILARMRRIIVG